MKPLLSVVLVPIFIAISIEGASTKCRAKKRSAGCRTNGDIVISMDRSNSVDENETISTLGFASELVKNLTEPNFRISYIAWGSDPKVAFDLKNKLTKEQKSALVYSTGPNEGATNTGIAVTSALDVLLDKTLSKRPGIPKILLIVTDGEPNFDEQNFEPAIEKLKKSGVLTFAIGIDAVENKTLLKLALGKKDHVFWSSSFVDLTETVIGKIIKVLCYLPKRPKTNETSHEELDKGDETYYCYTDKKDGVSIYLETISGQIEAVYSFKYKPEALHGGKKDGVVYTDAWNCFDAKDKAKEICVMVRAKRKNTEYKIKFTKPD